MKTTIDRAGRIVIPKKLRDEAGLAPGTEVEVIFDDGRVAVEAVPVPMRLEKRGYFLVAVPERPVPPLKPGEVERIRRETYVERERRILGQA